MKLLKKLGFFKKKQASSQMERRLEERHPAHFPAILTQQESDIFATILNFSKSGLAMLSPKEIQPDEIFEIQLAFNSERNVSVKFKVASCRKVETGYIIGSQIVEPTPGYDDLFSKIIQPRHSVVSDCW